MSDNHHKRDHPPRQKSETEIPHKTSTTPDVTLLLTILQEPNPQKARQQYLSAFGLQDLDDQPVYDEVERHVFDATMRGAPVQLEMELTMAQVMLLIMKKGISRARGGQRNTRHQELSKKTLLTLARKRKAELVAEGMDATQAHLQAAEEAEKEGRKRGLSFKRSYLAREIDKSSR